MFLNERVKLDLYPSGLNRTHLKKVDQGSPLKARLNNLILQINVFSSAPAYTGGGNIALDT